MKELWTLFQTFFRIGALTFGGGYAMLPMFRRELVERHGWVTDEEIMNYYAVGQCTPGIIAINTATFVGYYRRGIAGAIVATFGMVAPSLVIIMVIAAFLKHFAEHEIVRHAFAGIRVAVAALILQAVVKMWKSAVKDWIGVVLFVASFCAIVFLDVSPLWITVISACIGMLIGKRGVTQK